MSETLDTAVISHNPPPADSVALDAAPKNKGGRPKGAKTRPDAPSMIKKQERLALLAAPIDLSQAKPDTEIFSDNKSITGNSEKVGDEEKTESSGDSEKTGNNKSDESSDPTTHRPLATMIWDSIIGFMAAIVGRFWYPRKVGSNVENGEIPYDEREMVIVAFCKYFASVGMTLLSPANELWLAIATYTMPRLIGTVAYLRSMFAKKTKPVTPGETATDSRMPPKPEVKADAPKPEEKKDEVKPHTPTQFDVL